MLTADSVAAPQGFPVLRAQGCVDTICRLPDIRRPGAEPLASSDDEPPALAYIEGTLAQSYRKEIDQEENVWRSLPFFAATLALQLAALFQIVDKLPDPSTLAGRTAVALLTISGLAIIVALAFLAASIYPAQFDYIAPEARLFEYAWDLILYEDAVRSSGDSQPMNALVTLKTEIARQYGQATVHNKRINKRRELCRSVAGLAAILSVLATVSLVITVYTHYVVVHVQ